MAEEADQPEVLPPEVRTAATVEMPDCGSPDDVLCLVTEEQRSGPT